MRAISYARTRTNSTSKKATHRTWIKTWDGYTQKLWTDWTEKTNYAHEVNIRTESKTTRDTSTPNYASAVKAGNIICKDYQNDFILVDEPISMVEYSPSAAVLATGGYHKIGRRYGQLSDFLNPANIAWSSAQTASVDALVNRAMLRLYANIGASEMQALVTLVELEKSVKTIQTSLFAVWELLKRGRKIRNLLSKGVITAAKAANMWLEIRYGLRPMYYDIFSAVEAIKSLTQPERTRYSTHITDDCTPLTGTTNKTNTAEELPYVCNGEWSRTHKYEVRAGAICDVTMECKAVQAFGLQEIASGLWELVPFSFIVDWFLNTGDIFAALDPKMHINTLASWAVVVHRDEKFITLTDIPTCWPGKPTGGNYSFAGVYRREVAKTTTRYANPAVSYYPSVNIRFGWLKLLDLLALMRQVDFSRWRI